jgi:hypothetical protein
MTDMVKRGPELELIPGLCDTHQRLDLEALFSGRVSRLVPSAGTSPDGSKASISAAWAKTVFGSHLGCRWVVTFACPASGRTFFYQHPLAAFQSFSSPFNPFKSSNRKFSRSEPLRLCLKNRKWAAARDFVLKPESIGTGNSWWLTYSGDGAVTGSGYIRMGVAPTNLTVARIPIEEIEEFPGQFLYSLDRNAPGRARPEFVLVDGQYDRSMNLRSPMIQTGFQNSDRQTFIAS